MSARNSELMYNTATRRCELELEEEGSQFHISETDVDSASMETCDTDARLEILDDVDEARFIEHEAPFLFDESTEVSEPTWLVGGLSGARSDDTLKLKTESTFAREIERGTGIGELNVTDPFAQLIEPHKLPRMETELQHPSHATRQAEYNRGTSEPNRAGRSAHFDEAQICRETELEKTRHIGSTRLSPRDDTARFFEPNRPQQLDTGSWSAHRNKQSSLSTMLTHARGSLQLNDQVARCLETMRHIARSSEPNELTESVDNKALKKMSHGAHSSEPYMRTQTHTITERAGLRKQCEAVIEHDVLNAARHMARSSEPVLRKQVQFGDRPPTMGTELTSTQNAVHRPASSCGTESPSLFSNSKRSSATYSDY